MAWHPHARQRSAGARVLGAYLPFALNVLTFRGDRISDVTAFVARAIEATEPEAYHRWVDEPTDPERLWAAFEHFGMPPRLDR